MPLPGSYGSYAVDDLLSVTVTDGPSSIHVSAAGEVDSHSAPRLAAALETAIAKGTRQVVADLEEVTFLDSAGVHVLGTAHRQARAAGGRLRVIASRRAVLRPLQLTGLWAVLSTEADPCPAGVPA
jgi:anti-sigma B factor antagonist